MFVLLYLEASEYLDLGTRLLVTTGTLFAWLAGIVLGPRPLPPLDVALLTADGNSEGLLLVDDLIVVDILVCAGGYFREIEII